MTILGYSDSHYKMSESHISVNQAYHAPIKDDTISDVNTQLLSLIESKSLKARVGWSERTAYIYHQVWNRSPVQVGCMRQVLRAGALGRPRGMGWRGRREGGSGWGTHVNPWLIHVNVWQKPLQYCKVISLQLIKIN